MPVHRLITCLDEDTNEVTAEIDYRPISSSVVSPWWSSARTCDPLDLELVAPYTIGFFCGLRESELWKICYSEIRIAEKDVIVPAAFSKTKRKRLVPLSDNAIEWLEWYFKRRGRISDPTTRLLHAFNPHKLRMSQQVNFKAAAGQGAQWQQNCKRRAFASHFIAAFESLDRLALAMGHSSTEMSFERYIGAVSHEAGLAYFQIRP